MVKRPFVSSLKLSVDREIDRHAKEKLEDEKPATVPSGKSTGVLYGAPLGSTTSHEAQVVPEEVVNDVGGGRGSIETTDASVPLLVDVVSQGPSLPPLQERFDPSPEPYFETAADTTDAPLLINVSPSPQDFPPRRSAIEQQDPSPRRENIDGGIMNPPMTSNSELFVGSSSAMPVAEVISPHSTLITSTEIPAGSHPRRTWNSRVPSSEFRETRTSPLSNQSTPSLAASDPTREPPTVVKVTGYRILNTTVVLTLGIWKGVASYRNESILSNTLDILLGVGFAVGLYWLGFLETSNPPCLIWLFHKDYAVPDFDPVRLPTIALILTMVCHGLQRWDTGREAQSSRSGDFREKVYKKVYEDHLQQLEDWLELDRGITTSEIHKDFYQEALLLGDIKVAHHADTVPSGLSEQTKQHARKNLAEWNGSDSDKDI